MERRLSFAYGRALVLHRTLFLVIVLAALAIVALPGAVPFEPLALLTAVLALYTVLFLLSPLWTEHWLTRSRLVLRQGWYFRAAIPFAEIESATAATETEGRLRTPIGIHRPLGQPALFVTGGRTNLVAIRLLTARRFWQAFGLNATEIVFDVVDRPRFLKAFAERRALLPPVKAERADP